MAYEIRGSLWGTLCHDVREPLAGIELKVTVPEVAHRSTTATLGLDPIDAQIRHVYFFDTPDLRLSRAGVVVRARRIQGRGNDSVVKLRPVVPADLPSEIRRSPGAFPSATPSTRSCRARCPPRR